MPCVITTLTLTTTVTKAHAIAEAAAKLNAQVQGDLDAKSVNLAVTRNGQTVNVKGTADKALTFTFSPGVQTFADALAQGAVVSQTAMTMVEAGFSMEEQTTDAKGEVHVTWGRYQ